MLKALLSISLLVITLHLPNHSEALPAINPAVLQITNCEKENCNRKYCETDKKLLVAVGKTFFIDCRYNKLREGKDRLRLEFLAKRGKPGLPRTLMSSDQNGQYHAPWINGSNDAIISVVPKYVNQSNGFTAYSREAWVEDSGTYTCEAFDDTFGRKILYRDSCEVVVGHKPRYVYVTTHYNKNVAENKPMVNTFHSTDQEISGRCSTPEPHTSMTVKINGKHKTEIYDLDNKTKVFLINIMKKPELYDGATIECRARNNFGSVTNKSQLSVLYPPREDIIKVNGNSSADVFAHPGEKLICASKGNPQPQTTWLSPNLTLFRQTHPNVLVIRNTTIRASEEVVCEATQGKKLAEKLFLIRVGAPVNEPTVTELLTSCNDIQWRIAVVMLYVIFVLYHISIECCQSRLNSIMIWISQAAARYFPNCRVWKFAIITSMVVFSVLLISAIVSGLYIIPLAFYVLILPFTLLRSYFELWKLSQQMPDRPPQ